jgi:uncharacterized membrane protein YciS (DUF1049 family)
MEAILADANLNLENIFGPLIGMVAVVGWLGIAGAVIWYKLRVKQWEMSLKHTMLQMGMSAEEITAVLDARVKDHSISDWTRKSRCGTGKDA